MITGDSMSLTLGQKSSIFCTRWNEGQLDKAFRSTILRHFSVVTGLWIAGVDLAFLYPYLWDLKLALTFHPLNFGSEYRCYKTNQQHHVCFNFSQKEKPTIKKGLQSNQRPQDEINDKPRWLNLNFLQTLPAFCFNRTIPSRLTAVSLSNGPAPPKLGDIHS